MAESGPFLCHAMRLLGLPMLSLAPAPLGVGLATGAVRLERTASACRRSPAPLKRPRSRDLRTAKGWGAGYQKKRSTGRFWALVRPRQRPATTGASGGVSPPAPICRASCRRRQAPSPPDPHSAPSALRGPDGPCGLLASKMLGAARAFGAGYSFRPAGRCYLIMASVDTHSHHLRTIS
jgi:hypothetical protein